MTNLIVNNKKYVKENSKISVDYIHSDNLNEIEKGIKQTLKGVLLSKKAICIALARIKNRELYRQVFINSFKEYLQKKRIPLNYSTALDYSIIGEMLLKYENELKNVHFGEENGLQKLLLLEKGLSNYKDQPQLVFKKISEDSYRNFKLFVNNNEKKKSKHKGKEDVLLLKDFSVKTEDERIYLLPIDLDVLWLNKDIEHKLGIPGIYKKFQAKIIKAVKDFFSELL